MEENKSELSYGAELLLAYRDRKAKEAQVNADYYREADAAFRANVEKDFAFAAKSGSFAEDKDGHPTYIFSIAELGVFRVGISAAYGEAMRPSYTVTPIEFIGKFVEQDCQPIAYPVMGDEAQIRRHLDAGINTLLERRGGPSV